MASCQTRKLTWCVSYCPRYPQANPFRREDFNVAFWWLKHSWFCCKESDRTILRLSECCRTCTLSIWRGDSTFPCTDHEDTGFSQLGDHRIIVHAEYGSGMDSVWFIGFMIPHCDSGLCHSDGLDTMRFACAKGNACNLCPKSGKIEERNSLHFASMKGWTLNLYNWEKTNKILPTPAYISSLSQTALQWVLPRACHITTSAFHLRVEKS